MTQWSFTVWGPPRTKKNSGQFVIAGNRRLLMPSKAWQTWCKNAVIGDGLGRKRLMGISSTAKLNCRAHFYRDRPGPGDTVGYMQGLADLLEKRGVIHDDAQIAHWDGTRIFLDRENPRVEVVLEEL